MRSLPEITSPTVVTEILEGLQKADDINVVHWAKHKAIPWVICGYNQKFSAASSTAWQTVRRDTNPTEVSHQATYTGGKQLSLVTAWKL